MITLDIAMRSLTQIVVRPSRVKETLSTNNEACRKGRYFSFYVYHYEEQTVDIRS